MQPAERADNGGWHTSFFRVLCPILRLRVYMSALLLLDPSPPGLAGRREASRPVGRRVFLVKYQLYYSNY